jgi:FkbM family methyltransferase
MQQPSAVERLLVLYARHFPVDRAKMRVVDRLWRVAAGGDTHRIASLTHGGLKVPCDLTEMLQRQFYFFGTYFLAKDLLDCWEREARGAGVVLDVGANAGIFSLAALAAEPDAVVHAFEPTPEIADRLVAAAQLNGLDRLHVHRTAVSDAIGQAALRRWRGELGTNEGMNFITAAHEPGCELVPTVTLDAFCAARGIIRVDLLKIDIQGNEHLALAGARGLLQAGRIKTIFTELNWADDKGVTCPATETIRIMGDAGYCFAAPGRRLEWKPPGDWMTALSDVVARRPEERDSSCR